MATLQLPPDFREFLKLLNSAQVEYLLVGGYAVGYYGYPRGTGDMDIWVASTPKNAAKILTVLEQFGFAESALSREILLKPDQIVRMGVPPIRIELLTSISGVTFSECYARRMVDQVDGIEVSLIGLQELKINKKAAGRLKDLNDLEELP
jgi:hypothetical protein